ncbi:MAG TPA: putative baseplate assembly protein [Polyangia bacterium]|nr:putative baseplate assembly protein [Polyangia bacterium]
MIPTPKLDDRTYADIVAEALRLIPRYCPEWTNHNPSDPGITLLELTAWMTELILYRLNRVPEKNYLTFLDLIGVRLRSPQPARTLLTFSLVEGAERQVIREGMQISTPQAADDETIVFETERDLLVTGVKLDRCFSYFDETYADNSPFLGGSRPEGFEIFAGTARIDRYLYLGDPRFSSLNEGTVLQLRIGAPEHGGRDLARLLEWEYWNGRRWRELRMAPLEVERGEVIFVGPADIQATTVHNIESTWIRGRLAEVPRNPAETEIDTVRAVIETIGEGQPPELALANIDNNVFIALDLGKNHLPFGSEPKVDHCFYLASREFLSQPGAEVRIELALSEPAVVPPPVPSEDLLLSWEYFDGKRWRILGRSTTRGALKTQEAINEWNFQDGTGALSRSGIVSFTCPADIAPGEVSGEDNYWVRARIEVGDFGIPGSYMLDGDQWVWKDERPLRPPALKSISFKYRADLQFVKQVLSYNDFRFRDHSDEAKLEYRPFQAFAAVPDEGPTLYLGFDGKLPNEPISLYFQLAENIGPRGEDRSNPEQLRLYYAQRDALWEAEQKVVWEYWDGDSWAPLVVKDGTKNFTASGFIDFVGPDDHELSLRFAEDRRWIRARLEMGGYVKPPVLVRVLQNTVSAANVVTIRDEVLGSSDGSPIQVFALSQGQFLEGEVMEVREREAPNADEVADLGEGAVRAATEEEGGGYWVRWRSVESFYASGPRSRHYLRNPTEGKILFGDGSRGMMPPEGRNNMVARRYQIGGGTRGNVNAHTLTALTRSIAYVESVTNPVPAGGGADAETVEEAKVRAPMEIKSRDRAVTAEDFESLALRASTGIARAKCLPSGRHDGHVELVIVPKGDDRNLDLTRKLVPPPELLRYVKNFIDDRRLVSTVVEVVKPSYLELSIKITLIRRTVGQTDRLRREIENRLRRYLHPLIGGRDGKGWPFGRAVYKSDLAHVIEDIPGVELVDAITIYDEDRRVAVEAGRLGPHELVHLVNLVVVERVREEIV